MRSTYPTERRIDLLKSDEYATYLREPHRLREELAAQPDCRFVIIDEIQKVPSLLDEVHWLVEEKGVVFALSGSSARKVRRGHANLLGGRAVRHELFGLVSVELGPRFDLPRMVQRGYLPTFQLAADDEHAALVRSYVDDYLKEEIAAEGLVRNLPAFAEFLFVAALSDADLVSYTTIARECGVSAPTVKGYYEVLADTLLGRFLPAFRARPKRRVIQAPKFYFADVGVVNHLARRGSVEPGSEAFGRALENWVCHELAAHSAYSGAHYDISYWRLASGGEVDFILGDMSIAVEVKATRRAGTSHLRGLRTLIDDHPSVRRRILVCLEDRPRRTDDGIDILPAGEFALQLWDGQMMPA